MKIQEKAMLVNLSIREWSGRKLDKQASREVAEQHNAAGKAGNFNKLLIAADPLKPMQRIRNQARAYHNSVTCIWGSDGTGILPSTLYADYSAKMREYETAFFSAVDAFLADYWTHKAESETRLGTLFNASEYPTADQLKDKYGFDIAVLPLPDAGDFRVNLANDELTYLRDRIETQLQDKFRDATRDLWGRLQKVVTHLATTIRDPDAQFKNSIIGNISDLVNLLPTLNITGDPALSRAIAEVRQSLSGIDPQALRDDKAHRAQVARTADSILDSMAAYMGSAPAQSPQAVQSIAA